MTPAESIDIIGEQGKDDYKLQPSAHAALYGSSAAQLARVLKSSKLSSIASQYETYDARAGAAQTRYKSAMERANRAVLLTAVFSALMMATQILISDAHWFALAFGLLSVVSGGLAAMWLNRVSGGRLLEAWMAGRAEAETARLSYFTALIEPDPGAPDPALDLLKLEYFRRYQLDVQRIYYDTRGREHEESADRTLRLGSYAVAFSTGTAAVSSGALGTMALGSTVGAPQVGGGIASALGALVIVGSALSAYAGAREAMAQDRRNAERYARTYAALSSLSQRLDEVRGAVAQGNSKVLAEFVAAVNEQISLEHRQWLRESESTKAAEARLTEALKPKPKQ